MLRGLSDYVREIFPPWDTFDAFEKCLVLNLFLRVHPQITIIHLTPFVTILRSPRCFAHVVTASLGSRDVGVMITSDGVVYPLDTLILSTR